MQTIENPFDMLFKKLNSIENQLKHLSTANGKQGHHLQKMQRRVVTLL